MKTLRPLALTLLASSVLTACTTIIPGNHLTLTEGQSGKLGNRTLTLLKVQDSRCPVGMDCVWAGDLVAEVRVVLNRKTSTLTLRLPNDTDIEWPGVRIESATQDKPVKVTFTDRKP